MGWADFRDKYITGGLLGERSVEAFFGGITGETAADAALQAGNVQAAAQLEQLEYLKQINELPQQYREQALTELAGIYGLGEEGQGIARTQEQLIEQAKTSPLYQELLGTREAGEEALLRTAGATGGLRSGDVQRSLYDYNTQLERQALTQAFGQQQAEYQKQLAGLQGLAGTPTYASQIAQTTGDIGTTQAQSILGAAQAQQQGIQNTTNLGLGIGALLI